MKFTGERVVPGQVEPDLMNEHMARYRFAAQLAAGKTVLDVASGAGYGSAVLGETAKSVFGADIDMEAVLDSRRNYGNSSVGFTRADCSALPFPDRRFDLVVAFEIAEHLENPERLIGEISRVVAENGIAVVSTPNRLYYTDERGETNEFHHHEFTYREFDDALKVYFPYRRTLLQNHVPAVSIMEPRVILDSPVPATLIEPPAGMGDKGAGDTNEYDSAYFFVAVCSKSPLPPIPGLCYLPSAGNVLRERERHIRCLTQYLDESRQETAKAVKQLELGVDGLVKMRADYEAQIAKLETELKERAEWAASLNRELSEKGETLQSLQKDYDEKIQWAKNIEREVEAARAALSQLQKEFDERTAWALRMRDELEGMTATLVQRDADLNRMRADFIELRSTMWNRIGKALGLNRSGAK